MTAARKAQEWDIERWDRTALATEERVKYLKNISISESCEKDKGLPTELVDLYF